MGIAAIIELDSVFLPLIRVLSRLKNAATATVAQGEAVVQANAAATAAQVAVENEQQARNLALVSSAQVALSNNDTDLARLLGAGSVQTGHSHTTGSPGQLPKSPMRREHDMYSTDTQIVFKQLHTHRTARWLHRVGDDNTVII